MVRPLRVLAGIVGLSLAQAAEAQCTKDVDCKGDRICSAEGACVDPPVRDPAPASAPPAPPATPRVLSVPAGYLVGDRFTTFAEFRGDARGKGDRLLKRKISSADALLITGAVLTPVGTVIATLSPFMLGLGGVYVGPPVGATLTITGVVFLATAPGARRAAMTEGVRQGVVVLPVASPTADGGMVGVVGVF